MPRSQQGLVRLLRKEGIDPAVVAAFEKIDRSRFVPPEVVDRAYGDRPVGLPEGQTTSQPSLIARMVEAAKPQPRDRVLEVGTGYGFQTALLAQLVETVVSIERSPRLAESAGMNLRQAGIDNVTVVVGDGWEGVPQHAPYASIIVSAAATEVPPALAEQLIEGGRLIIPIKTLSSDEVLLFEKRGEALQRVALLTPARFVPLVPGAVT